MSADDSLPANGSNNDFDSDRVAKLFTAARGGDQTALSELLNQHRNYLLFLANQQMDNQIQTKVGSSDIVQESMLTAQQHFSEFEGDDLGQLKAWLRQILMNDVYEAARRYKGTAKRQLDREQPLQYSSAIATPLVDPNDTPKTKAVQAEEAAILKEAMNKLPQDYQDVIQMRNWEQLSFVEIGERLDRSEGAARKLWTRAILKLQEILNSENSSK